MFGNKLEAANQRIAALVALVNATGVTLAEGAELPTVAAFTASLATARQGAIDAALAPVNAQLASASAANLAYQTALAAAGVKLPEFKSGDFVRAEGAKADDLTPAAAAVKTAVETAITARAAKQVASSGHDAALDIKPGEGSAEPTSAELFKQFNAITDATERAAFYAKHKAKLLR